MDVFKPLPFLQAPAADLRPSRSYAEGFGNRVASRNAFAPLRAMPARQHRRHAAPAPALAACGCR